MAQLWGSKEGMLRAPSLKPPVYLEAGPLLLPAASSGPPSLPRAAKREALCRSKASKKEASGPMGAKAMRDGARPEAGSQKPEAGSQAPEAEGTLGLSTGTLRCLGTSAHAPVICACPVEDTRMPSPGHACQA